MDGPGFDLWTRRRFGQAATGFAALALARHGQAESDASTKKRKRRRRRCKRLGDPCQQGGKRKCCGELRCDFHNNNAGLQTFCCKTEDKACSDPTDCCEGLTCCGLAAPTCKPPIECL